ncbi:CDK-activating kinase assembly factor MAT1-domain-containing protein [Schizophyllum commune]
MSSRQWIKGTTVRKGGAATSSHPSRHLTPTVQSTSSTVFGGGVKDPSGRTSEYSSENDQCPVCKTDRYLNPKLRLLVSSQCYDKMCESCIDRLFTLGPAACPTCGLTTRKLQFIPQTFEDLGVEKEVAVRRRIAREFNKRREDFVDLRAYNDYLEEVEDIAFNLIHDIDREATEARIKAYHAENQALIELNEQREKAYADALKEQEEFERRDREARASELRREEEEERQERERDKRALIDKLEASDKDAIELVARQKREAAKRQSARTASNNTITMQSINARLLRNRAAQHTTVKEMKHVPLLDDWYGYEDMFALKKGDYDDIVSEAVRRDREGIMRGGGYRIEEAWERAIRTAVASLDLPPLSGLGDEAKSGDVAMAGA